MCNMYIIHMYLQNIVQFIESGLSTVLIFDVRIIDVLLYIYLEFIHLIRLVIIFSLIPSKSTKQNLHIYYIYL